MSSVDIVILILFLPGIVQGITKGFIKQLVSLAAILLGIWIAWKYYVPAAELIEEWFKFDPSTGQAYINALSFAIIFIGIVLVLNIIGGLLTKLAKATSLGGLNRLLGVLFSILKTALILAVLASLFDDLNGKWELVKPEVLDSSKIYPLLRNFADTVIPSLKEMV